MSVTNKTKHSMHQYSVFGHLLILTFSNFYVGSMCLVRRLHLARSYVSSLGNSLSDKSFLMLSNHLRFGLPLLLFPGTSIAITLLPTYSSSLLNSCPYHFNLLSCTFLEISPTLVVPLILSFQILSSLVTPLIHLNILISTTSNFFSCAFFTAQVSTPYIIAGLTTVLYTFPLTLKLILRSLQSLKLPVTKLYLGVKFNYKLSLYVHAMYVENRVISLRCITHFAEMFTLDRHQQEHEQRRHHGISQHSDPKGIVPLHTSDIYKGTLLKIVLIVIGVCINIKLDVFRY